MARENSSHAPGNDSAFGGERQRHRMGEGRGAMPGGDFGIGAIPGTRRIPGDRSDMAETLTDRERACPPCVSRGPHSMGAEAATDHGPHGHDKAMHDRMPKGSRPHHVHGGR